MKKIFRRTYLKGFQDGTIAGYELALTRVEALLHAEIKKLHKSTVDENRELRVNELRWVLVKVKGLYKR